MPTTDSAIWRLTPALASAVEEITSRCLEEFQNGLVLERRRVRHIYDDLRSFQHCRQPLAGNRVDTRPGGRRHDLLSPLLEPAHKLCSNQSGPADNDYLHICLLYFAFANLRMFRYAARRIQEGISSSGRGRPFQCDMGIPCLESVRDFLEKTLRDRFWLMTL